jgi:hypothetical protein
MYPDIARISRRLLRGTYQKVSQRLLKGQPKPKRCGSVYNGRFLTGIKSLHRTPQSRRWQMFWRMKNRRVDI